MCVREARARQTPSRVLEASQVVFLPPVGARGRQTDLLELLEYRNEEYETKISTLSYETKNINP